VKKERLRRKTATRINCGPPAKPVRESRRFAKRIHRSFTRIDIRKKIQGSERREKEPYYLNMLERSEILSIRAR